VRRIIIAFIAAHTAVDISVVSTADIGHAGIADIGQTLHFLCLSCRLPVQPIPAFVDLLLLTLFVWVIAFVVLATAVAVTEVAVPLP